MREILPGGRVFNPAATLALTCHSERSVARFCSLRKAEGATRRKESAFVSVRFSREGVIGRMAGSRGNYLAMRNVS